MVLATKNAQKLAELRRIVAAEAPGVQVLGLADVAAYPEPAETERTFEGNALLKACACVAATGLPALADDSGLAVDVLNQMPGVRSARWAGPGRATRRTTHCCCASWPTCQQPSGLRGYLCHGVGAAGWYRARPYRGHARPDRCQPCRPQWLRLRSAVRSGRLCVMTNGELEPSVKDAISHRGRAVRAILPVLVTELRRLQPVAQEG